ncbi:DUF2007 domain-containing protein [Polaribacter sp.]|nr:DUF2007 domain-containing protein [Polaribacter sp.]MDB9748257.1 DUF2007 domain-containing protein [Polaribacter sp.]MDB9847918.1 DUF2007 domain-containing protein [Polaribacter sp.]MDC1520038.1 DUF2007 domain-containing protein [Polaribacter sp.]
MTTAHIKVFSGSSIIVKGLAVRLEDINIGSITKDHIHSGTLAGFGTLGRMVELFILNTDLEKATPILETYKEEINS